MDIVEKLIEFIFDCKYLTEDQKKELEMDFRNNRKCIRIFEDVEKEAQIEKEKLEEEIERLERLEEELAEFEAFQGIKDAVENFVKMKIKERLEKKSYNSYFKEE